MRIHKTFKTRHWSGGTTTELFIYPPQSSLKALDFQFRLSLATIETPESIFTPLPNVHRHFMVLDGNIELNHKGHHDSRVEAFQQDHFEGDWHTSSKGTAFVFNLMFRDPAKASIEHVRLYENEEMTFSGNSHHKLLVFLQKGEMHFMDSDQKLEAGQLAELDQESVTCLTKENVDLIVIRLNS